MHDNHVVTSTTIQRLCIQQRCCRCPWAMSLPAPNNRHTLSASWHLQATQRFGVRRGSEQATPPERRQEELACDNTQSQIGINVRLAVVSNRAGLARCVCAGCRAITVAASLVAFRTLLSSSPDASDAPSSSPHRKLPSAPVLHS